MHLDKLEFDMEKLRKENNSLRITLKEMTKQMIEGQAANQNSLSEREGFLNQEIK